MLIVDVADCVNFRSPSYSRIAGTSTKGTNPLLDLDSQELMHTAAKFRLAMVDSDGLQPGPKEAAVPPAAPALQNPAAEPGTAVQAGDSQAAEREPTAATAAVPTAQGGGGQAVAASEGQQATCIAFLHWGDQPPLLSESIAPLFLASRRYSKNAFLFRSAHAAPARSPCPAA